MASSTSTITITSPLNYVEGEDIDSYTAYTDALNQPSRAPWVLNQTGLNTWTANISSGGGNDSADSIPIQVPTGYEIQGYSLTITSSTINSGAIFDFADISGGTFDDNRALATFSSNTTVGPGLYSILIGNGTNVLSYQFKVNIVSLNAAPVVTTSNGSAAFVESATAAAASVAIDSGLTVADSDNTTLASATVSITGNYKSTQDSLALSANAAYGNIAGSYSNGVLTLTSNGHTATLAQFQAALRSVAYTNTSDTPDTSTRTISFKVNDGTVDSSVMTRTVTVAATNDPSDVTTSAGSTAFVEGNNVASTPVVIDSALTVSDRDSTTLTTATVSITGNLHTSEDILVFTNNSTTMGNITGSYTSGTGVLSLSSAGGTATLAQWQAALQSVTYTNSSETPDISTRTISFVVYDVTSNSAAVTKTVTVTSVNDSPVVTTSGGTTTFTEGGSGPSNPVPVDNALTLTDRDSPTLTSATVKITGNFTPNEDVLSFVNDLSTMGNISESYNAVTGELTLSSSNGTASVAQWQAALRAVTYTDTSDAPSTAPRTITFTVNDGASNSAGVQKTVTVTATNDAPVMSTTGGTTAFTSGNNTTSTPVAIDAGLSVSDPDNATLSHATVSISQNFKAGEDVLSFINTSLATFGNISATFDSTTGELGLSSAGGTATVAQWQAALRSVTYVDTAITPDASTRTISFKINDGQLDSTTATKTVSVAAVDNSPVLESSSGASAFVEGNNTASTPVIIDSGITVSDLDSSSLRSASVTVTNVKAGDTLAFTGNSATMGDITAASYNANTGELALSSASGATLAQWQAALRSVGYSNSSDSPDTSSRNISFTVNDGNSDSAPVLKTVTVQAVNDTPVVVIGGPGAAFVEGNNVTSTPVTVANGLLVTDLDNSTLASAAVSITGNLHSGEDVLAFNNDSTAMGNISGSYNASTGVLTLTSSGATASLTEWQAALRSVTYTNLSDSPSDATRTISVTVNDGTEDSIAATQTVTVTPTNDVPVITLPVATPTFTEDAAAVIVNPGIVLSDVDSSTLVSAKVSIAGFVAGEDKLALPTGLPNIGDIVASFNAATGELTLTSASHADLTQWQAALRAVTYENTSQAPSNSTRTVSFTVNDGNGNAGDSASVNQVVTVVSVNDAPDVTLGAATQSVRQNTPLVFSSANHNQIVISDVDAGSSDLKVTLTANNGLLALASGTGLVVTGDASGLVTLQGTLSAINAALNGLKFTPTTGFTGNAVVDVAVNDLDLSNPLTADTSVAITVTPPPAPPTTPTNPPVTIDGVPVTNTQVTLPNGETGTSVSVGLTTSSRQDSTGDANTADINLVGSSTSPSLLAKLPVGYGLTSVSGGIKLASNSAQTLKAAIDAVTASTDQAHQNVNGQHFLDKLAAGTSLLVNTITPVTASTAPTQSMELDGAGGSQHTALVIDTTQMNGKGSLVLNNVDFAAVVGATTVQGNTTGQTLTGDDASQSFIVNASDSFVFAGGGNDTLKITTFTTANNTVLQGGQGNDTVQFSGDRSQYTLEQHGGYTLVSNKDDPNQQVKVVNVENLGFADGVVSIPTNTQQTTLAALYEGLLGRQADVAGFDYWTEQPMSIGGVGLSILNSTEAGAKALNGDVSHDIAALYTAFFGRTVDTAGQAYWTEQVQQGHLTFVQVADSLLTSTEMTGHNKAPATWDFTV